MLRLIHNQTVQGGILVDDIDDGLPNKEVHRLGSSADPKAYVRDGYANKPKQSCYVPFSQANKGFPTIPGYINVTQTDRVTLSAGKGKIFKLSTAPGSPKLISVVSLTAAQVAKATISAAAHGPPVTITASAGTFLSVSPDITTVFFAQGTGVSAPVPASLTAAQIIAATGTVGATSISIPAAAFSTPPVANNTVYVQANEQNSNTFTLT